MGKVLNKEDLKDTLKQCSCCKEVLHASTDEKESKFGAFWNGIGWYYQSYCKACAKEKAKYYTHRAKTQYILEQIRLKRDRERAARDWTVYKITLDITKFDNRVKAEWRKIHSTYFYIGITKQIAENRWNEHLYNLKNGTHSNYFLQCLYSKIRELYKEMSDNEYYNFFKDDIMSFEVVKTLDKNYTEVQAKIAEAFEVKRLEHSIRIKNKEKYIQVLKDTNYNQEQLMCCCSEMVTNIEHCKSSTKYKKELDKKNNSSVGSTQVTVK
ncbi:MAG: hypothetical protein ACRCXT_21180 [Paraclostridium sp.]